MRYDGNHFIERNDDLLLSNLITFTIRHRSFQLSGSLYVQSGDFFVFYITTFFTFTYFIPNDIRPLKLSLIETPLLRSF